MNTRSRIPMTACMLGLLVSLAPGGPLNDDPRPAEQSKPRELTVAVLDFAANSPGEPDLGKQIGEMLTAFLSGDPGFKLVDRAALQRTLQEAELNLSGLVTTEQAVQVGKLVGARILVVGKAFPMSKQMFITAKLIGTETSLVEGVVVKAALEADMGDLVVELAQKISERLRETGPKLVAQEDAGRDPLPDLQARLAKVDKPTIAVVIPEHHVTAWPASVPDPAVETEIKSLLRQCGFKVKDVEQNELADFAKDYQKRDPNNWPRGLAGVDVVIVGEGFSEFAARIGNLVSCVARAEINLIQRSNGQILLADRTTERGVDLSQNFAGKSALQKAGRVLGVRVLEYFCEQAKAEKPAEKE